MLAVTGHYVMLAVIGHMYVMFALLMLAVIGHCVMLAVIGHIRGMILGRTSFCCWCVIIFLML